MIRSPYPSKGFNKAWTSLFLPLHREAPSPTEGEQETEVVRGEPRWVDSGEGDGSFQEAKHGLPSLQACRIAELGDQAIARWTGRTVEEVRKHESNDERVAR